MYNELKKVVDGRPNQMDVEWLEKYKDKKLTLVLDEEYMKQYRREPLPERLTGISPAYLHPQYQGYFVTTEGEVYKIHKNHSRWEVEV